MATDPEPGADIPNDAAGAEVHLGQGHGPNLRLRDKAAFGSALGKKIVRIAEESHGTGWPSVDSAGRASGAGS